MNLNITALQQLIKRTVFTICCKVKPQMDPADFYTTFHTQSQRNQAQRAQIRSLILANTPYSQLKEKIRSNNLEHKNIHLKLSQGNLKLLIDKPEKLMGFQLKGILAFCQGQDPEIINIIANKTSIQVKMLRFLGSEFDNNQYQIQALQIYDRITDWSAIVSQQVIGAVISLLKRIGSNIIKSQCFMTLWGFHNYFYKQLHEDFVRKYHLPETIIDILSNIIPQNYNVRIIRIGMQLLTCIFQKSCCIITEYKLGQFISLRQEDVVKRQAMKQSVIQTTPKILQLIIRFKDFLHELFFKIFQSLFYLQEKVFCYNFCMKSALKGLRIHGLLTFEKQLALSVTNNSGLLKQTIQLILQRNKPQNLGYAVDLINMSLWSIDVQDFCINFIHHFEKIIDHAWLQHGENARDKFFQLITDICQSMIKYFCIIKSKNLSQSQNEYFRKYLSSHETLIICQSLLLIKEFYDNDDEDDDKDDEDNLQMNNLLQKRLNEMFEKKYQHCNQNIVLNQDIEI